MALKTRTELPPGIELEAEYQRRAQEWESLPAGEEALEYYQVKLFPLACLMMRALATRGETADLFFVPVGTQPFSPLLTILAQRARVTVLLHTERTRAQADTVVALLAEEGRLIRLLPIGDGTAGVPIVRAVLGEYAAQGFPDPRKVVVDLTGGRKATTAVLGSIAATRGFGQVYIEGQESKVHRGFFYRERHLQLVDVRPLLGETSRACGLALLRAGAFTSAEQAFSELADRTGAAALDLTLARVAAGWAKWMALDWRAAARFFHAAAAICPLSEGGEILARWAQQARELHAAAAGPKRGSLLQAVEAVLAREALARGDRPRAAGLLGPKGAAGEAKVRAADQLAAALSRLGVPRPRARSWERRFSPPHQVRELLAALGLAPGAAGHEG